ncbi:lytic transglycosylase domain-containing protein [Nitratireductor sp. GCM10026969]|uniref:lytic transglycosylase domain-containing protein n=1 Tax=Nitratireductor sp. GCM10026969 TaxID=3252645 RepID=UPI00360C3ACA
MQVKILIAAAIAVGAMTAVSNAQDNSSKAPSDTSVKADVEEAKTETLGDLMKRVLRAGDATAHLTTGSIRKGASRKEAETDGQPKADGQAKADTSDNARPYHDIVSRYASEYGVPVNLAHAVIAIESNYRASARGRAGEVGLMQIKPSTARGMGYGGSVKGLYDPDTNIRFGMKYLAKAYQLGNGSTCGAILRYNAGHGARRMNAISSAYCNKVKSLLGTS